MTPSQAIQKRMEEFDEKFKFHKEMLDRNGYYKIEELKSFSLATSLALIESFEADIERRKKYTNWSHTRGSHSDDSQDTEPCDCRDEEVKIKNGVFDDLLKLLSEEKEKINSLMNK
jgi:hypothetical protein